MTCSAAGWTGYLQPWLQKFVETKIPSFKLVVLHSVRIDWVVLMIIQSDRIEAVRTLVGSDHHLKRDFYKWLTFQQTIPEQFKNPVPLKS